MDTTLIIGIVVVLAVVAFIVWAVKSDNKLKAEDPEAWRAQQIKVNKNNPDKLRELGASEDQIKAAEDYQAQKAAEREERKNKAAVDREDRKFNMMFNSDKGIVNLNKNVLTYEGKKYDITGAAVGIQDGREFKRVTATRFIAYNAMLSPLAGAAAGALHQKDTSKLYIVVELPNSMTVTIPTKRKNEAEAMKFAERIGNAGIHFASKDATER